MTTTEKTVLLVEDNSDDVTLILRAFATIGFTHKIVVARDGQEALDYLFGTGPHAGREGRETLSLILLDLSLPRMRGLDVLEMFRSYVSMNHIPLVVLTGSTEVDDRKAAEALGVTGYLRKPVTFEELVAIARDVVKVFETGG